jgi:hypothetical protein
MRVALLLKEGTKEVSRLSGALVLHGLSGKQAMDTVTLLAEKDVVLDLSGIGGKEAKLHELNAYFRKFGLEVVPAPAS